MPDRPTIRNESSTSATVVRLEDPAVLSEGEDPREVIAELEPGELVGSGAVSACRSRTTALVAIAPDGGLLDRWDDQDCDDDDERPEEWRITDNSRRGPPP